MGDGNLSNPNGRATRLRITCDKKYPKLIRHISDSLKEFLPDNRVGKVNRKGCVDVYCYSNKLEYLLGWKANKGSKLKQKIEIPRWIFDNEVLIKECLRGLIQTDGSIYMDRGYLMVNITSVIPTLTKDIIFMINKIGYKSNLSITKNTPIPKYTIRISNNVADFINDINVWKA